eukprot:SAG11_NODE_2970_length_2802_cov_6.706252_1_plen_138_part_00
MRTMGSPGWRGNLYLSNECVLNYAAMTVKQADCAAYVMSDYRLLRGNLLAGDRDARGKLDVTKLRLRDGFWTDLTQTARDDTSGVTRTAKREALKRPGGPNDAAHTSKPKTVPEDDVKTDFGERGRIVTLRLHMRNA